MAKFSGQNIKIQWGDMVYTASLIDMNINTDVPMYESYSVGGARETCEGQATDTITATAHSGTWETDVSWDTPKEKELTFKDILDHEPSHMRLDNLCLTREHYDGVMEYLRGRFGVEYKTIKDLVYSITRDEHGRVEEAFLVEDDTEDNVKKVYHLVVVNKETHEVWDGGLFIGDGDANTALQTILLERADKIKEIGAPNVVGVTVKAIISYDEIDDS